MTHIGRFRPASLIATLIVAVAAGAAVLASSGVGTDAVAESRKYTISYNLLSKVCRAFGGRTYDADEDGYGCEFNGSAIVCNNDSTCEVVAARPDDGPPLRDECDQAGGAYSELGNGLFSCELTAAMLEIYRDELDVYHIDGREVSVEIDIRNGEITTHEVNGFLEDWTGENLEPLDTALFAVGDGASLTASQFDTLISGEVVEGFELTATTANPGPASTLNDWTDGADWLAKQTVIFGLKFAGKRFILNCRREGEWQCKVIRIDDL